MAIPEISAQTTEYDRRNYLATVSASFTGGLTLKTEEGDLVNLSFQNEQSLAESESQTRYANNGTIREFSSVAVAASRYSLTVQGDLNEEELDAIQRLVDEIGPIARGFFAQAEFDLAAVTETLAGSLGVIDEIKLELERVITTTFAFQQYSSNEPINIPNPGNAQNIDIPQKPVNTDAIRNLPELVFAAVEAELEAQAAQFVKGQAIMRSFNDLMRFLQQQLGQFLNPLGNNAKPNIEPLPQGIGNGTPPQDPQV